MLAYRRIVPILTAAGLLALAPNLFAQEPADTLRATLSGETVVGGGDQDGRGLAIFEVDPGADRLCYEIQVSNITEATATHVHRGTAGQNGPPVLTLSAPRGGSSADCADVDGGLVDELLQNPAGFYVNVHNPDFPGGAVRGQLGEG